jgi:hypothetical protein
MLTSSTEAGTSHPLHSMTASSPLPTAVSPPIPIVVEALPNQEQQGSNFDPAPHTVSGFHLNILIPSSPEIPSSSGLDTVAEGSSSTSNRPSFGFPNQVHVPSQNGQSSYTAQMREQHTPEFTTASGVPVQALSEPDQTDTADSVLINGPWSTCDILHYTRYKQTKLCAISQPYNPPEI